MILKIVTRSTTLCALLCLDILLRTLCEIVFIQISHSSAKPFWDFAFSQERSYNLSKSDVHDILLRIRTFEHHKRLRSSFPSLLTFPCHLKKSGTCDSVKDQLRIIGGKGTRTLDPQNANLVL